jgi:hypothetical protein
MKNLDYLGPFRACNSLINDLIKILNIFNIYTKPTYAVCLVNGSRLYMQGSGSEEINIQDDTNIENDQTTEQLNKLREQKKELEDTFKENQELLEEVDKAEDLHNTLPIQIRDKNAHLNKIKKEFDVYFDEDSGNTTLEGLDEVKGHLEQDQSEIRAQLFDINNDIKQLQNQYILKPSTKRKASDTLESEETKRSRDDDDGDSNNPGSGSLPPFGPSASSSNTGSSSSVFKVECDKENNFFYQKLFLDFIICILNAFSEDDQYND